jgi:fermentation-respiration switch protein FrsA (DUF1100 family)
MFAGCTLSISESILFFPTEERDIALPGSYVMEEIFFPRNDAIRLNAIFLDHDDSDITILLFHGQGGNIWRPFQVGFLEDLMAIGHDIFVVDYRGYGKSEGEPTLQGIYADGRAAWDYLEAHEDVDAEKIVIYGFSLGTAVAVDVAREVDPAGLILEGSFTGADDMVEYINKRGTPRVTRPFFKLDLDSSIDLDLVEGIREITCPVLFLHGEDDDILPMVFAIKLFGQANMPKTFIHFPGASHEDLHSVAGESYSEAVKSFIKGLEL